MDGRGVAGVRSCVLDGLRVLVIESWPEERAALHDALADRGASVEAVGTAGEGLLALVEWHPDVLLSDVDLDDGDGCAMMARVRTLGPEDGGGVPAAALSVIAGPESRARALAAGFQEQIEIPAAADTLVALVTMLGGRLSAIETILDELRTRSAIHEKLVRRFHALRAERERLLSDNHRLRATARRLRSNGA